MASRKDSRLSGLNPLAYLGVEPISPPLMLTMDRAPTSIDYANYNVGTFWIDRSAAPDEDIWFLADKSNNVARWLKIGAGSEFASEFVTDAGTAIPVLNVLNVLGGELIGTTGVSNDVTINLDRGLDGQLIIGAAGSSSAYANLTSIDASVTITNAPNAIDLSVAVVDPGPFEYANLGLTVDTLGSTITLHSSSGAALSASNSAKITFASKATPGTFVTITISANVSIDWSDMDNNTMGTEGSLAWGDPLPLYVYGVLNDNEDDCTFGLGRVPHHAASGAAANIGTPSSATANNLTSMFLFEDVTIGNYDDNPVVVVGSVTATKDGSDSWSFSVVKGGTDGIGALQVGTEFLVPNEQMGADNNGVGSDGGTVPIFTSSDDHYSISPDGFMIFSFAVNALSVIGVGANELNVIAPLGPSQGIVNTGIACVGDAGVSVAAVRGVYRAIPSSTVMPGGFTTGIVFVKNETRRLQLSDFDTVNAQGSNLTGSISYLALFNVLP